MRDILVSLIIILTLNFTVHSTAWIDPILKKEILNQSEEYSSVIVLLNDLRDNEKASARSTRDRLRRRVLSILQKSGFNIAGFVDSSLLWISNAFHVLVNAKEIQAIAEDSRVKSIVFDSEISLELPQQETVWGSTAGSTWGLEMIEIPRVWEELDLRGKGVRVGILDTGYSDHPALKNRIELSRNFMWGQDDGKPNDGHGHGTHCLGTIGGSSVNGKRIGVAPEVRFLVGRIFNNKGKGGLSTMLKGMQWLADPDQNPNTRDQPSIVSNSWGVNWKDPRRTEALHRAVKTWKDQDIIPVFAAGNSGYRPATILKPAVFEESITVGATDSKDKIASFSSRGPGRYLDRETRKPDVTAPGVSVYSSDLQGKYSYKSGTSMAAPHVVGIIALMLEANPNLSTEDVRAILRNSALDLGQSGYDHAYGWGRIDGYQAVKRALDLF